MSDLNKKIYGTIEAWRNRPIEGEHPYVYLDGIVLKRSWAGEIRNVSLLVAIGMNNEGYREILGICEGAKEDKAGWTAGRLGCHGALRCVRCALQSRSASAFETAIIERYRRRESSVEEALIEMYLAGVSVRHPRAPLRFRNILNPANASCRPRPVKFG